MIQNKLIGIENGESLKFQVILICNMHFYQRIGTKSSLGFVFDEKVEKTRILSLG
jgi:hypothetical protein